MLRHKNIDRLCCLVLALTVLLSGLYVGAAATGLITADTSMGYETRLFDQSRVHTIDIVIQDWEAFLDTCTSEEYSACHLVIDGESYKNVAIRGKGNTSLSSVATYGNDRYSFKVEFDHYQSGNTYYGLDKLSLNNLIQDNTYMKDYFAYTLMGKMGVAAPLCSFVRVNVNGEYWGLYLAVEGVEDAFLQRNYGKSYGELYKPDSLSFGGGRGNGRDFDMDEVAEKFGFSFDTDENGETTVTLPDMSQMGGMQMPGGTDPNQSTDTTAPTMPTGGTMPDMSQQGGMQMPGGIDPNQSTDTTAPAMPTGGTMPDMGQQGGMQMPGGIDPNQSTTDTTAPTMPTGGTMPDMGQQGGMQMPDNMPDMGGDMGMGSDDVKLLYSDDEASSYSNIFDNAKTDVTEADQARLIAAIKALNEGDTSVVNTDAVLRYMAVHNFLCNDDSYTGTMIHNYYLYEEDGVLEMIPWDYNLAMGGFQGGSSATSTVNSDIDSLVNGGGGDRPMADWITASEDNLAAYHAVYAEFMAEVFESGWFAEEIDRVIAMISPYVESDPTAFCTYEEFQTGAQTLKSFCLLRAESVANQLSSNNATVDASSLSLSAMGGMNQGGGMGDMGGMDFKDKGGFGRGGDGADRTKPSDGDAAQAETSSAPEKPTGDGASTAPEKPTGDGTSTAPEKNTGDGASTAPEKPTGDGTSTAPEKNTGDGASATMEKPTGDSAFTLPDGASVPDWAAMEHQGGQQGQQWLWLAVCAAVLIAGCIAAGCFKTNR